MVIGGSSHKVRDAAPASFFCGHSTGYFCLQHSAMPVYLAREARLALPAQQRTVLDRISGWLHARPLVSATA